MKQILLVLSLLFSLSAYSQDFVGKVFDYSDSVVTRTSDSSSADLKIYFNNKMDGGTSGISWKVVSSDIPEGWGNTQVCDNINCYYDVAVVTGRADLDTVKDNSTNNFFKFSFSPKSEGTATIVIAVGMGKGDTLGQDTLQFSLTSTYVSVNELSISKDVKLYPNPAVNFLNVSFGDESKDQGVARIYNMIGQEVKVIELEQGITNIEVNIEDLNEGPYFMKIYDNDGQAVTTKRFTKKS